ncbi:MAG: hypothetical protein EOP47_20780, partial [Sphingobacteriaceae bacterium]
MRNKFLLYALAILLMVVQSCKKSEPVKSTGNDFKVSGKLRPNAAPSAYGVFQLINVVSGKPAEISN